MILFYIFYILNNFLTFRKASLNYINNFQYFYYNKILIIIINIYVRFFSLMSLIIQTVTSIKELIE